MDLWSSWDLAVILNKSFPMRRVQSVMPLWIHLPGWQLAGRLQSCFTHLVNRPRESLSKTKLEKQDDGLDFYAVTSFLFVKNEIWRKLWTLTHQISRSFSSFPGGSTGLWHREKLEIVYNTWYINHPCLLRPYPCGKEKGNPIYYLYSVRFV